MNYFLKDAFQLCKSDCVSVAFLFKSYLDSIFSALDFTSLSKGMIKTLQVLMIFSSVTNGLHRFCQVVKSSHLSPLLSKIKEILIPTTLGNVVMIKEVNILLHYLEHDRQSINSSIYY